VRDNHDGYPEILDAYERDGSYFGALRVTVADEVAAFEFGVEQRGLKPQQIGYQRYRPAEVLEALAVYALLNANAKADSVAVRSAFTRFGNSSAQRSFSAA
jgi:hypothetical protein